MATALDSSFAVVEGQSHHSRSNEDSILYRSAPRSRPRTSLSGIAGFSIVELSVSLCVLLILTAIAVPTLMRSLRAYQLNDAATRVSAMLKFTRFEAVRRNTTVNFLMQTSGTGYLVGTDSNKNSTLDATEKQELIAGFATILPSSAVPAPTAIITALGGTTPTPVYGSPATITFDSRGAIRVGGAVSSNIFVIYIGSAIDPDPGYRAVLLFPGGTTQIWSAPQSGNWQLVG